MTLARTGAAAATAVVLLVTGCSEAGVRTATDAPIVELVAQAWDATDDGTDAMVRMEDLISQCMDDAGFDYRPVDYTPVEGAEQTAATDGTEPGTRGYAELYGYGIVDRPEDAEPSVESAADWVDPNEAYVGALDTAEQDAYWAALTGSAAPSDTPAGEAALPGTDDEWQYDWRTAGCRGWAQNQVFGDPDAAGTDTFAALQRELEQARLDAAADPRTAALESAWAACMADAGHPGLRAVADAEAAIRTEVTARWDDAWSTLPAGASEADIAAVERATQADLRVLAATEVATALADLTCRDAVSYDAERERIAAEHQQQFTQAHRVELEAWVASSEGTDR
jgi:hypothetical protein